MRCEVDATLSADKRQVSRCRFTARMAITETVVAILAVIKTCTWRHWPQLSVAQVDHLAVPILEEQKYLAGMAAMYETVSQ